MTPRIAITRTWSDNDVAQLAFEVCDGSSVFANEAYVPLNWGVTTASALRAFGQQIYGGLFDLQAGEEGFEYASGHIRARFHWYKPDQLLISTWQQGAHFLFKGSETAADARLFLKTEPALLDRFVAALPSLDAQGDGQATLECVRLPR
jgi:hypothetical protein